MKKNNIWHILLVLYILFVFSNSLTPAELSSEKSSYVLQLIHKTFDGIGVSAPWLTEHVIRKAAHFGEYTVMGILLFQSMSCLWQMGERRYMIHEAAAFFIPFMDETLQLFTEGRSGQLSDVWLDMSGIVFGTVLFLSVKRILTKKRKKSLE